jgi:hypothetical protein
MDQDVLLPVYWRSVQTLGETNAEQHISEKLEIQVIHQSELLPHPDI